MEIEELANIIKNGQTWRLYYGEGNGNNRVLHIRSDIIDGEYFVTRSWSKTRKRWRYMLEDIYFFHASIEARHLTKHAPDVGDGGAVKVNPLPPRG